MTVYYLHSTTDFYSVQYPEKNQIYSELNCATLCITWSSLHASTDQVSYDSLDFNENTIHTRSFRRNHKEFRSKYDSI